MQTIEQALDAVMKAASSHKRQTIEVPDTHPIGGVVRQGDVLYVRVADGHKHGKETGLQVVTGTTTGSRHTVSGAAKCYVGTTQPKVLVGSKLEALADAFLGACVVSPERFECPHPEHGHYSLPAGTWQVVQQMDERTRQRMAD